MKTDTIMMIGFMFVLGFLAVSLLINTSKSCDVHIDYDVTVSEKTNTTNASLAEVKLACYRLCTQELRQDSSLMRVCLEKCEVLE